MLKPRGPASLSTVSTITPEDCTPVTHDETTTPPPAAPGDAPAAPPAGRYDAAPRGTAAGRRRGRTVAVVVALAACVGVAAWFTVAQQERTPISTTVHSFDVVGPEAVDVTFDVTMRAGTTGVCTVDALSESYAQVGTVDVPVGPNDGLVSRYTVTVRTSEEATTGVVAGCRTT